MDQYQAMIKAMDEARAELRKDWVEGDPLAVGTILSAYEKNRNAMLYGRRKPDKEAGREKAKVIERAFPEILKMGK